MKLPIPFCLHITVTISNKKQQEKVNYRRQIYTHTHLFNGPLSGTIQVSRYQKDKTNLDFTEARDSEWQ